MEQGICILCKCTCDIGEMDKLCTRCWGLKTGITNDPNLAIILLDELGYIVSRKLPSEGRI